jgi:DNA-directed RNA polymerase subunit RPC12/RpoP
MKEPLLQMKGKHMNTYMKFACIYCGQHMECTPRLCGCHILCPACGHRIVIPVPRARPTTSQPVPVRDAWDTWVPMPLVEIPTRYRNRMARNAVLA